MVLYHSIVVLKYFFVCYRYKCLRLIHNLLKTRDYIRFHALKHSIRLFQRLERFLARLLYFLLDRLVNLDNAV